MKGFAVLLAVFSISLLGVTSAVASIEALGFHNALTTSSDIKSSDFTFAVKDSIMNAGNDQYLGHLITSAQVASIIHGEPVKSADSDLFSAIAHKNAIRVTDNVLDVTFSTTFSATNTKDTKISMGGQLISAKTNAISNDENPFSMSILDSTTLGSKTATAIPGQGGDLTQSLPFEITSSYNIRDRTTGELNFAPGNVLGGNSEDLGDPEDDFNYMRQFSFKSYDRPTSEYIAGKIDQKIELFTKMNDQRLEGFGYKFDNLVIANDIECLSSMTFRKEFLEE